MEDQVRMQTMKDLGVYDLIQEQTALEFRLKEIKRQTEDIMTEGYHQELSNGTRYYTKLDAEIQKRLDEMNKEFRTASITKKELIREVRLSGVVDSVKATINQATEVIRKLTEKAKKLPPLTVVQEIEA